MLTKRDPKKRLIEVCEECGKSCCAQGEFMCDLSRSASTVLKTYGELLKTPVKDRRENRAYWSLSRIESVYGDPAPFGYAS